MAGVWLVSPPLRHRGEGARGEGRAEQEGARQLLAKEDDVPILDQFHDMDIQTRIPSHRIQSYSFISILTIALVFSPTKAGLIWY